MGGGALDEDPLISARRELKEETGLHSGEWRQLMRLHTSNSVTDEEGFLFLARDLQSGSQALGDTERDLVVKKLPLSEALGMIEQGKITDVISIAGLLAVEKMLS
jgi:8-oxo-dGTP pyrophosphatase MutT (NUDIX family)